MKIAPYDYGEVESCENETSIEIIKSFSQRCDQLDVFFATKPHELHLGSFKKVRWAGMGQTYGQ